MIDSLCSLPLLIYNPPAGNEMQSRSLDVNPLSFRLLALSKFLLLPAGVCKWRNYEPNSVDKILESQDSDSTDPGVVPNTVATLSVNLACLAEVAGGGGAWPPPCGAADLFRPRFSARSTL